MKFAIRALVLVPLLALSHVVEADPVRYRVDVIGSVYDFRSTAINNRGQVTGSTTYEFTEGDINYANQRAFMWDAGTVKYVQDNSTPIYGTAINDAGVMVGATYGWNSDAAVLGSGGATLIGAGPGSWATAINNSGQIAVAGPNHRAYVYASNGTRTDIGNLGYYGWVNDLNEAGAVVGRYASGTGPHAFRYADGSLHDLGTLGGTESEANAINDSGMTVGDSYLSTGHYHAAIYGDNGPVDLGTFGGAYSSASAINNLGQVVGYAYDANQQARGFLYQNGTMSDLNAYLDPLAGWTVSHALGINDNGQILVSILDTNRNEWEAVLSPVPAPGGYATLLVGLAMLGTVGARRRAAAARTAVA